MIKVNAFIQARMSSSRFPGKSLAPIRGIPIIESQIERVAQAMPREDIVILTSQERSDNPLAMYVESLGVHVYRGNLLDVFNRFHNATSAYPCDWFIRMSGDSPYFDPRVIELEIAQVHAHPEVDLITNVQPRTFSPGCSAETVKTATFLNINMADLTEYEREHVIPYFYNHPDHFRIINVESSDPKSVKPVLTVDTVEDLKRLERGGW